MDTMDEEELLEDNLLGMPAIYWKDMNSMDYTQMLIDEQNLSYSFRGRKTIRSLRRWTLSNGKKS